MLSASKIFIYSLPLPAKKGGKKLRRLKSSGGSFDGLQKAKMNLDQNNTN